MFVFIISECHMSPILVYNFPSILDFKLADPNFWLKCSDLHLWKTGSSLVRAFHTFTLPGGCVCLLQGQWPVFLTTRALPAVYIQILSGQHFSAFSESNLSRTIPNPSGSLTNLTQELTDECVTQTWNHRVRQHWLKRRCGSIRPAVGWLQAREVTKKWPGRFISGFFWLS